MGKLKHGARTPAQEASRTWPSAADFDKFSVGLSKLVDTFKNFSIGIESTFGTAGTCPVRLPRIELIPQGGLGSIDVRTHPAVPPGHVLMVNKGSESPFAGGAYANPADKPRIDAAMRQDAQELQRNVIGDLMFGTTPPSAARRVYTAREQMRAGDIVYASRPPFDNDLYVYRSPMWREQRPIGAVAEACEPGDEVLFNGVGVGYRRDPRPCLVCDVRRPVDRTFKDDGCYYCEEHAPWGALRLSESGGARQYITSEEHPAGGYAGTYWLSIDTGRKGDLPEAVRIVVAKRVPQRAHQLVCRIVGERGFTHSEGMAEKIAEDIVRSSGLPEWAVLGALLRAAFHAQVTLGRKAARSLTVGVDVARPGSDRSVVMVRDGDRVIMARTLGGTPLPDGALRKLITDAAYFEERLVRHCALYGWQPSDLTESVMRVAGKMGLSYVDALDRVVRNEEPPQQPGDKHEQRMRETWERDRGERL